MQTKRFLGFITAIVMLVSSFAGISAMAAKNGNSGLSYITKVEFYVQRRGMQMDEEGHISSRPSSLFTPLLYTGKLNERKAPDYTLAYDGKEVTSDDIVSLVYDAPSDEVIFGVIIDEYKSIGGELYTVDGELIDWDEFTTDNFETRWYVLKMEDKIAANPLNSGVWHIDGVIVDKDGDGIEIVVPTDPTPEPVVTPDPEPTESPDPEPTETPVLPEYESRFAYIYGYDDTTMGADGNLIRSEISAMIHRLAKQNNMLGGFVYNESNEPVFSDIAGEWFRSGIEYMNSRSAFDAAPGENVYPYAKVTRGEAFKLMCLGLAFTDDTSLSYDDYAQLLYNTGYIEGDENGNLNIDNLITRAEFCTIYNRVISRDEAGLEMADGTEVTAETYGFADLDPDEWYYETMLKATSSYDEDGYVDLELREDRNVLDDFA